MLGMAIQAFNEKGEEVKKDEQGELVCVKPFPCQPLGFWPLKGYGTEEEIKKGQERYKDAYFAEFEGIWCESFLVLDDDDAEWL
jgi:acetoacetyl-CoA synthetase